MLNSFCYNQYPETRILGSVPCDTVTKPHLFVQRCVILSPLLQPIAFTLGHQQTPICHIWGHFLTQSCLTYLCGRGCCGSLHFSGNGLPLLPFNTMHNSPSCLPIISPLIQPLSALRAGSSQAPALLRLFTEGCHPSDWCQLTPSMMTPPPLLSEPQAPMLE